MLLQKPFRDPEGWPVDGTVPRRALKHAKERISLTLNCNRSHVWLAGEGTISLRFYNFLVKNLLFTVFSNCIHQESSNLPLYTHGLAENKTPIVGCFSIVRCVCKISHET